MSSQSSYHRTGSRSFYPLASINLDPGPMYGATREMGPPTLDSPPQPVEIDLNSSRTLPSPSAPVSNAWDTVLLQPPAFGDVSYGASNVAKYQQFPVENQNRGPTQDPLLQWYTGNDGPWIPKSSLDIVPEDRLQSRFINSRNPMTYPGQYKPNPSDTGSFHFGVPHSDSGYGTRRSDGNTSVFSADVPERDQDCQSITGHVGEFQQFQAFGDVLPQRDGRTCDVWATHGSSATDSSGLICQTCNKPVKTQSELKKHDLRHRKPFLCKVTGCSRSEGFSTTNDLERHTKSKHPTTISEAIPSKRYRCYVAGCKSKDKSWPRLDNFRSHLKRVHLYNQKTEDEFEEMIRRAEYLDRNGLTTDEESTLQPPSLQEPTRAIISTGHESFTRKRKSAPDWKPISVYPDVIEPSKATVAPKGPQLALVDPKATTLDEKVVVPEISRQDTVQPMEVFRPHGQVHGNVLETPAGPKDPALKNIESITFQLAPQTNFQGKASRQSDESASDATITEIIKTVSSGGAKIPDLPTAHALHKDEERGSLPNGKVSPRSSWPTGVNSASTFSKGANRHINLTDSPSSEERSTELDIQKKAQEVLKFIRDLGYTVSKDPTRSPKYRNVGSAASNKSENQVLCQTCKKFKGRPCELKKHMKRHERPYGCTFPTCNKLFGSKNDWKRHENSQHFHLETWRCEEERREGGPCAKVCYRRQTFQDHLKKEHQISDLETVKTKLENYRIGRNCQARFWCGFCRKLVSLNKHGLEAWGERFDHIDDHFMGRRDLAKQGIQDWVPLDGDQPKGDFDSSPESFVESPDKEGCGPGSDHSVSTTPIGHIPDATGSPGRPSGHASIPDNAGSKRDRPSNSDDDNRQAKRLRAFVKTDTYVLCCQCRMPHNPKFDPRCTNCENSHQFCNNCSTEAIVEES